MSIASRILRFLTLIVNKVPILFLPIYWLSFLVPRKSKIWVFGSSFGKSFTGNPKYFYLYVNNIKTQIRPIWISEDDSIVSKLKHEGYEAYNIYSLKGILFSLRAKVYVFDHYSKDICFWLSGRSVKINLWHGIPLKKGHRDNKFDKVRNPTSLYDRVRWIFRRVQNEKPSHYYSVTSEKIKALHKFAFRALPERIFVCGYSRNDVFFENNYLASQQNVIVDNNDFYRRLKKSKSQGSNIITYMPTFRESEDKFFDVVDLNELNKFLDDSSSILLVKAHHLSKITKKFEDINYSNIFNIKSTEDPYPYLNISDILITDYSSVYFDYLLLNRPIIFFPYDINLYISESRELYYEYDSVTPGPRVENMSELIERIKYYLSGKDEFEAERKRVFMEMFDFNDSNSSERLYKKILEII